MGRRRKEAAKMGKSLIKDRFRGKTTSRGSESFLHTTELNDGYEGRNVNLQSLTEQTSMDDFLMTAELAGRDFTAEKENVQIVTPQLNSGVMSADKLKKVQASQDRHQNLLRIPRRPSWDETTPADKLRQDEHISFLEWRRQLAKLQEEEHIVITPYEKNLEFWRQLWRVIERSDVVVQIVDARNPRLFWCPDLDKYVKEVDSKKQSLLLINKADLLTDSQRQAWAEYFAAQGVHVVFWSAVEETARLEKLKSASADTDNDIDDLAASDESEEEEDDDDACSDDTAENKQDNVSENIEKDKNSDKTAVGSSKDSTVCGVNDNSKCENPVSNTTDNTEDDKDDVENREDEVSDNDDDDDDSEGYETIEETTDDEEDEDSQETAGGRLGTGNQEKHDSCATTAHQQQQDGMKSSQPRVVADSRLQTSDELLALFRGRATVNYMQGVTTVGMVGYPNVGKSSTINAILQTKKVPVSATPGRTKHFQTLYVEKDLMLCDCPGLVFPSFVNSKAELVVNGILPIDQLQDSEPPVELVCHRVGRRAFEALYHINLPPPEEWEDPDKAPSAYDLLQAYGALRGFMSHKGNPDRPRAARYILKDFVNGKLLFCHPPPGIETGAFQKPPYGKPQVYSSVIKTTVLKTTSERKTDALNQEFFSQSKTKAHAVGPHAVSNYVRTEALRQVGAGGDQVTLSDSSTPSSSQSSLAGKPWKRHNNRNKKEKLRRVYKDLDTF